MNTQPITRPSEQPKLKVVHPELDPGDLMAVVKHYQTPLLRYVGQILGGIDSETEDVVQETFIRLHKQVQKKGTDSVKHLTTWLFRVAHNQTIDLIRKRSRRKNKPDEESDSVTAVANQAREDVDALEKVLRQEARQLALQELSQLDGPTRQVVLLKVIQDMTLREVAKVLNVSLSTVNYRLNQGLTELARRLKQAGVV